MAGLVLDVGAVTVCSFEEILTSHSKGINTLTASHLVDPAGLLTEAPTDASPDLMRSLLQTMINAATYVGYAQDEGWGAVAENSGVPTAAIQFAHDIGIRACAEQSNTIMRWTDINDRGGHFAALEEPEALVTDIREFLRPLRD